MGDMSSSNQGIDYLKLIVFAPFNMAVKIEGLF